MKLLAILVPPLAVLLCGKPIRAALTLFLCVLLWLPAVFYAWSVVNATAADKRTNRIVREIKKRR